MFLKLMGAMPGYIYGSDAESLYVNLFVGSRASAVLKQTATSIRQTTKYPWDGAVKISVDPAAPTPFNLKVRIPAWCRGASLKVNGEPVSVRDRIRGYAQINRTWKKGDVVELLMPMPVETVKAHPLVEADAGKVALTRGPLVYCLESADNSDDVRRFSVRPPAGFNSEYRSDLLGGVTTISGTAWVMNAPVWQDSLYAPVRDISAAQAAQLVAIPYYANANRGPVQMTVWLVEST
jgi:DUF1680 family protein